MAKMDRLFGVTMEQKGISRLVAVNLEQANRIKKNCIINLFFKVNS
jgi:hypothetical protein